MALFNNCIESLGRSVFNKRNRWIINLILGVAVVAFAGVMVVLPFAGALQGNRPKSDPSAPATPGLNDSQRTELENQVKGYESVLAREPNNQTALRGLLDARIQLGDVEGTIEPLEQLVAQNPSQTDYAVLLAQAKQETGDREGAAQVYRDVLDTQPGNMNALQGMVTLLLEEERPEMAVNLLQDTLKMADNANQIQPGSIDIVSVQLLLGRVYAESGQVDQALAIYDEAAKRDAQDFRPVLAKAIVLQSTGREEEAQPLFESAKAIAPPQYTDQIQAIAEGKAPGQQEAAENPAEPAVESDVVEPEAGEPESVPDPTAPAETPASTEDAAE